MFDSFFQFVVHVKQVIKFTKLIRRQEGRSQENIVILKKNPSINFNYTIKFSAASTCNNEFVVCVFISGNSDSEIIFQNFHEEV